jgi:hypothetical protein
MAATARTIASTSSRRAAGKSRPKSLAAKALALDPPTVPTTLPTIPASAPTTKCCCERPIAEPVSAPMTTRPANWGGTKRLGVFGSLSFTISPTANRLVIYGVNRYPRKASQVPSSGTCCLLAAQLAAARPTIERRPQTIPNTKAEIKTDISFSLYIGDLVNRRA